MDLSQYPASRENRDRGVDHDNPQGVSGVGRLEQYVLARVG